MIETNALKAKIENLLLSVSEFADEKKNLKINVIKAAAEKGDVKLLEVLLKNEETKKAFFTSVLDSFVFKTAEFKEFLEYSTALNSYSKYLGKKIGLYMGDSSLTDRSEVVLNFPFKDCVLEGGQKKEDGLDAYFEYDEKKGEYTEKQGKRREIFYNEVLARDEIDSLFMPKAFCNAKRYGENSTRLLGEGAGVRFNRNPDGTITDNLIIKGNNLLALHSLKKEFAGKVKLIYIDPPYNTGSDSFAYNDSFNHSSWLTFMKNRLEVAKELLREDGVIFIQCDDNEQAYLKVLCDEVFGRENFVATMIRTAKAGGGHDSKYLSIEYDYVLTVAKNISLFNTNKEIVNVIDDPKYKFSDDYVERRGKYYLRDLDFVGSYSVALDYPIKLKSGKDLYAGGKFGKPNTWRWSKEKLNWGIEHDFIVFDEVKEKVYIKQYQFVDNEDNLRERKIPYRAIIQSLNSEGAKEHSALFGEKVFDFPKPESLLERILQIATKENDIVLDYHLGSGTTAAVAHKMKRQYIGVEQMDYIESVSVERLKKVIAGEQGGISKAQNWLGGGSFVYLELAEKNETALKMISTCNSLDELKKIFDELCSKYFLHYNVRVKDFRAETERECFKSLSLDEQKEMFSRLLDLNQLYVNADDRHDESSGLTENDIAVTEDFYSL